MALGTILGVNLVTPKGVVAHTEADSVQAPGELGEFELLPGHIPLLTALKPGVLTVGTKARARYAVGAGYLLSAQLYGVKFWDPVALAVAAGSLTLCALVAALIPGSRAASIPPMHALRLE